VLVEIGLDTNEASTGAIQQRLDVTKRLNLHTVAVTTFDEGWRLNLPQASAAVVCQTESICNEYGEDQVRRQQPIVCTLGTERFGMIGIAIVAQYCSVPCVACGKHPTSKRG